LKQLRGHQGILWKIQGQTLICTSSLGNLIGSLKYHIYPRELQKNIETRCILQFSVFWKR
jgi:hypothetical protein